MSPAKDPRTISRDELTALYDQLSTWTAVEKHLGLSHHQLHVLKRRLGVPMRPSRSRKSRLVPYHDSIATLAAGGATCPEIVRELNLPVQPEQVRRYMHKHGIALLAKEGAQPGERNHGWKGGRIVKNTGYVYILMPDHPYANSNGYVQEHRLVMQQQVGRYLEPGEVVHHVNGDRGDNRPENLELFSSNGEHLAETLKGNVPNWSDEGKARIVAAVSGPRGHRNRKPA